MEGRLFVFLWLICLPDRVLLSVYYPSVFWTPNNCRFNLNKPDAQGKTGYFFKVRPMFSHVFFVCPSSGLLRDLSTRSADFSMMYENLIMVDKESYESCSIRNTSSQYHNRRILTCDQDQSNLNYTEEIFSRRRALHDKVQYTNGKDYYFISTSNGTKQSLNNTKGGHCKTHNMKLRIYLCSENDTCEFEMPKCPYTDIFGHSTKDSTTTLTTTCGNKTGNVRKVCEKGCSKCVGKNYSTLNHLTCNLLFEVHARCGNFGTRILESTHMILHVIAAVIIFILLSTLACVVYFYRKKSAQKTQDSGNAGGESHSEENPLNCEKDSCAVPI